MGYKLVNELQQKLGAKAVLAAIAGGRGAALLQFVRAMLTPPYWLEIYDANGVYLRLLMAAAQPTISGANLVFSADYQYVLSLAQYQLNSDSRLRIINLAGDGIDGSLGLPGAATAFHLTIHLTAAHGIALSLSIGYPSDIEALGTSWWGATPSPTGRANSYYFSNSGSDSTGAGSLLNPWRTIEAKVSAVAGNSTLFLKDTAFSLTGPLYRSYGGRPVLPAGITIRPLTTCKITATYPPGNNDGVIVAWGGERDIEVHGIEYEGFGSSSGSGTFTLHGDIDGFRIVGTKDSGNGSPNTNGNHWLYLSGSPSTSHANAPRNVLAQANYIDNGNRNQGAVFHSYQARSSGGALGYGATNVTILENFAKWSGFWGGIVDPDYAAACNWVVRRNVVLLDASQSKDYYGALQGYGRVWDFWQGDSVGGGGNRNGVDASFLLDDNLFVLVAGGSAGGVITRESVIGGGTAHAPTLTKNRVIVLAGGAPLYNGIAAGSTDQAITELPSPLPPTRPGETSSGGGTSAGSVLSLSDSRLLAECTAATPINSHGTGKYLISSAGQNGTTFQTGFLLAAPNSGASSVTPYGQVQAHEVTDTLTRADTGLVFMARINDPMNAAKKCFEARTRPDSPAGIRYDIEGAGQVGKIFRAEFTGYAPTMTGVPLGVPFVACFAFRVPSGAGSLFSKSGISIFEFHNVNGSARRFALWPGPGGAQFVITDPGVSDTLLMTVPKLEDDWIFLALDSACSNDPATVTNIGYGLGQGGAIVRSTPYTGPTMRGETAAVIPVEFGTYDFAAVYGSPNGATLAQYKGVAIWRKQALAGQPDVTIENVIATMRASI